MKKNSRLGVAAIAALTILSLAGCSGQDSPKADPSPTPSATATNSPVATPGEEESATNKPVPTVAVDPETGLMKWCDPAKQEPFKGEAATTFGADSVMDAYCQMVDVEMEFSFIDSLMRADSGYTAEDFAPQEIRDLMLPSMQKVYDDAVDAVVAGTADEDQRGIVRAFINYNTHNGSGYTLDTPAVYNQSFTPATTAIQEIEGEPYLLLSFDVKADLAVLRDTDNKEFGQDFTKTLTFRLQQGTKNSTHPWFIEGYQVKTSYGDQMTRAKVIDGYNG